MSGTSIGGVQSVRNEAITGNNAATTAARIANGEAQP
jgi:hypothetical protein